MASRVLKTAPQASARGLPQTLGSFDLLVEHLVEPAHAFVTKWRSRRTGLSVALAQTDSPLFQGTFSVPTEIFDDSGCPHTLEHLNFCGSRDFPWNGVLDKVSNRSLGTGTNAWTAVDSTSFTFSTASQDGFLNVLPIYADHVFHALLSKDAFLTEVYHINEKGEEEGVVFSEMQGRSTSPDDIVQDFIRKALYNKDNAYRSETGGLLPNLRRLTIDQIRMFRDSAYLPENVTITIVGPMDPWSLLQTIEEHIEPRLIELVAPASERKRPFIDSKTARNPPVIPRHSPQTIAYPDPEEHEGRLTIAWIGPDRTDLLSLLALEMLGTYLCENAIGRFTKLFVEKAEPDCDGIAISTSLSNPVILTLDALSVPLGKLDKLADRILKALRDVRKEGIDLVHMRKLIEDGKRGDLENYETGADAYFQTNLVFDALYGLANGGSLPFFFADQSRWNELEKWSQRDWQTFISRWFLDNDHVVFLAKPSKALHKQLASEKKAAVARNVHEFGLMGLAERQHQLDLAKKANAEPVPASFLRKLPVPDMTKIQWFKVLTARALGLSQEGSAPLSSFKNTVQDLINREGVKLPLFVQFDHIRSAFIEITILMFPDRSALSLEMRELVPLYVASFFSLPLSRADGTHLTYEQVVRTINTEIANYSISTSDEGVAVTVKMTNDEYAKAIQWLDDLLFGSVFDVERLQVIAAHLAQGLEDESKDASTVAHSAMVSLMYQDNSNEQIASLLHRIKSVPNIVRELRSSPKTVVKDLERLRKIFTDNRTMRVSVKGDILKLKEPSGAWLSHFAKLRPITVHEMTPIIRRSDVLTPIARDPHSQFLVYCVPSSESTYSHHVASGPTDDLDPEFAALKLALLVLNSSNGPVWNAVRGQGLAYGATFGMDHEIGQVSLHFYRAPNAFKAFLAVKKMLDDFLTGKTKLDLLDVESAQSQMAYATADSLSTLDSAADASFSAQVVLGKPQDWHRQLMSRVQEVTPQEALGAMRKWLSKLFDPAHSVGIMAAGDATIKQNMQDFRKYGYVVEQKQVPSPRK